MLTIPMALELLCPHEKTLRLLNAGKNRQNIWQLTNSDVISGHDDFRLRICNVSSEFRFRNPSVADQTKPISHTATGDVRKPLRTRRVATTSVLEMI